MSRAGDGTTIDSCMGCDPALPDCFPTCQALVDQLYTQCDSVCLPDGYYFDPRKLSILNICPRLVVLL